MKDDQTERLRRSVDILNRENKGKRLFAEYRKRGLTPVQAVALTVGIFVGVIALFFLVTFFKEEIDLFWERYPNRMLIYKIASGLVVVFLVWWSIRWIKNR